MICPDCESAPATSSGLCQPCTLDRVLNDMMHLDLERIAQIRGEACAILARPSRAEVVSWRA